MVTESQTTRLVAKICGVRDEAGAEGVAASGADYAGLLFVPGRRRSVDLAVIRSIVKRLGRVEPVGVFLDSPLETVVELGRTYQLPWIQLHGLEPPSFGARLREMGFKLIRALSVSIGGTVSEDLFTPYRDSSDVFLLDGPSPGSGQRLQEDVWPSGIAITEMAKRPVWLAGGLNSGNVFRALRSSGAVGADVASGVEIDGKQDPLLMREFVRAVRGDLL